MIKWICILVAVSVFASTSGCDKKEEAPAPAAPSADKVEQAPPEALPPEKP